MYKFNNFDGKGEFDHCNYYNWRLNWLEDTIKTRMKRGEKFPNEQYDRWYRDEHTTHENAVKDLDTFSMLKKDTCILICSHSANSHMPWLNSTVSQLKKLGYYIMLSFDNYIYKDNQDLNRLPKSKILNNIDQFLLGNHIWASGVGCRHKYLMFNGSSMAYILGFKYIICINGDIVLEKPEKLEDYLNKIRSGEYDAFTCEYIPGRYFGTMLYCMKTKHLYDICMDNFNNFFRINWGNEESRFGRYVNNLGLKVMPVVNPKITHHFHTNDNDATFRIELGLRHYHAEYKFMRKEKLIPDFEKWVDYDYINKKEADILKEYFKTKNVELLKNWYV